MLKMLIADDEPVIIRGLQMLIDWAQLGIEICATCENGADALREIFAQSPDLALLDISMPGKTGIEILKALHTAQSRTKVIFISGFQDFSYAHDALSYGAVDYLLKPVKKDDLLRAVEKCLPVQPEHSAPAPASDAGSYSDAFSRVAEMEPTSYILTAVQPLGLNAKNTMERQLIEFSIFGQLDTLCRQTGHGTAFQKKGQCYLLLVNMTQAQAAGWLHEAQTLLEQRIRCRVGFVCSPATAEMSAVPAFTAPCRDACRWFYFSDHLPDTVLAMDAPPFGEAPADTAALHPLQEAVAAGFIETEPKTLASGYYISTSLLIALGVQDELVGVEAKADKRTIYSLSAPELQSLPSIGTAKEFDLEGCAALTPDLVIVPAKLKDSIPQMEELGLTVLAVKPEDQDKLYGAIDLLAQATNTVARGEALKSAIEDNLLSLREAIGDAEAPTVYMAGNSSVLQTAGPAMYQNYMIENAGGLNAAASVEDTYWAEVSYEQVLDWDPDYIILASDADYDVDSVLNDAALADCTAVKEGHVYQLPHAIEAVDSPVPGSFLGSVYLGSVLHPEQVSEQFYHDCADAFYTTYYGFTPASYE